MGAGITTLIVIAAAAVIVGGVALVAIRRVRGISRIAFGTPDIIKGLKAQGEQYAQTPKSVNGMTSLYLPQILKDFPAFNYYEFRQRAQNMLRSAFEALDSENTAALVNASGQLKEQLAARMYRPDGSHEHFRSVVLHRTEISRYEKRAGTCMITLQTSLEYYHYVKLDGEVTEGSETVKEQTRYDTALVYVQDETLTSGSVAGITCPNCGAPLKNLGSLRCEYCGAALEPLNIRVWRFDALTEC